MTDTETAREDVADAIRVVTSKLQKRLEAGRRSRAIDIEDIIDILLQIAEELDPE